VLCLLRRRRWASAEGADGWAASWDFIAKIVSVGCTPSVKLAGGFRDLNVSEIKADDDDEASASLRSGGGGTLIGSTGTFLRVSSRACW